jgi:hypothetical protein
VSVPIGITVSIESMKLFLAGALLVGVAASARRIVRGGSGG